MTRFEIHRNSMIEGDQYFVREVGRNNEPLATSEMLSSREAAEDNANARKGDDDIIVDLTMEGGDEAA